MSHRGSISTIESRDRMRAGKMMRRLYQCAMGEIDLTMAQLRAIEIALRKLRPDLKQIEVSGTIEHRDAKEYSTEELRAMLARDRERIAATRGSDADEPPLH